MNNSRKDVEYHGPYEIEGYLRKMPIKNRDVHKEKTTQKYFKVSLRDRKFCYKNHRFLNSWRQEIALEEFIRFIPNLDDEHRKLCEFQYGFQLLTPQKYLVLFCNDELFNYDWVRVFEYIIYKRELRYNEYEKFIINKDCGSDLYNCDKRLYKIEREADDINRELEFSFTKNLTKGDEVIVNSSTDKINSETYDDDYQTFKDISSEQIPFSILNNKKDIKYVTENNFKEGENRAKIFYKKNENYPSTWEYDFEPTYVDISSSRPIHELKKYKIVKENKRIKPNDFSPFNKSMSKIKTKDINLLIDRDQRINIKLIGVNDNEMNEINSNPKKNKNKNHKNRFDSDEEIEHSIELFIDKQEINDFINFKNDEINISKLSKCKSERLSTLPTDTKFETSNSNKRDDKHLDLYAELFYKNDSNYPIGTKWASRKFDSINCGNNNEKISNNLISNLTNSKSMNFNQINPSSLKESSFHQISQNMTYIPKKISNSNFYLNNNNFSSRGNSLNNKNVYELGNLSVISTSTTRSCPNNQKDAIYNNVNMHTKQHFKKEVENFGVKDLKNSLDDIKNALICSVPQNNSIMLRSKDDIELQGNARKKKKIIGEKLNHENSMVILKSFRNSPKNENVILEESLIKEGNVWVMNLKINKKEKI